MGRRYRLPPALCKALDQLLGPGAEHVEIIEHSRYARLHGAVATTRPNRIYISGSGDDFAADLPLVLHEYCHVLHQWETRRLSTWRYLLEWFRRGYWDNRFEVEAREFTEDNLHRFRALLSRARSPGSSTQDDTRPREV